MAPFGVAHLFLEVHGYLWPTGDCTHKLRIRVLDDLGAQVCGISAVAASHTNSWKPKLIAITSPANAATLAQTHAACLFDHHLSMQWSPTLLLYVSYVLVQVSQSALSCSASWRWSSQWQEAAVANPEHVITSLFHLLIDTKALACGRYILLVVSRDWGNGLCKDYTPLFPTNHR